MIINISLHRILCAFRLGMGPLLAGNSVAPDAFGVFGRV